MRPIFLLLFLAQFLSQPLALANAVDGPKCTFKLDKGGAATLAIGLQGMNKAINEIGLTKDADAKHTLYAISEKAITVPNFWLDDKRLLVRGVNEGADEVLLLDGKIGGTGTITIHVQDFTANKKPVACHN